MKFHDEQFLTSLTDQSSRGIYSSNAYYAFKIKQCRFIIQGIQPNQRQRQRKLRPSLVH